jgi:hypothetical protein
MGTAELKSLNVEWLKDFSHLRYNSQTATVARGVDSAGLPVYFSGSES